MACFETHDFRVELAHALLIRGEKPEMPKTDSPQALWKKRFSLVLSTLKNFGVLNPVLTPHLLLVLYAASTRRPCPPAGTVSAPGTSVGMIASCWFIIHCQGWISRYLSIYKGETINFSASCCSIFPSPIFRYKASAQQNAWRHCWLFVGIQAGRKAQNRTEKYSLGHPGREKEIEMPFFFSSWGIRILKGQSEHHQMCMETW